MCQCLVFDNMLPYDMVELFRDSATEMAPGQVLRVYFQCITRDTVLSNKHEISERWQYS